MSQALRRSTDRPKKLDDGRTILQEKTPKQVTRPSTIVVQPVESTTLDTPVAGSSTLPTWLDGLASADHVGQVEADHGEPSQLGNMDHMSWELRTETVADEKENREVSPCSRPLVTSARSCILSGA